MVATTETFQTYTLQTTFSEQENRPRRLAWVVALSLLALQFLPCLLLWDQAYLRIHDTLEGICYQNLFHAGMTFDYSPGARLEQVMNGLPRAAVKTGWSFVALWHWLFGLYGGYIFNYVLVHVAAFFGMYLLLRNHFLTKIKHQWLALGVALCFAWLPVFTMLGMSVAGLPLVAWALIPPLRGGRGSENGGWASDYAAYVILTLFPFYSDIVWAGIPVLSFSGAILLHQFWKTGRWNRQFFAALAWMAALYIAVNWQLFQLTFSPGDFLSHRAEYDYFYNKQLNLWHSLRETAQVFILGHHHVGIFISLPVLLAVWFAWRRYGSDKMSSRILSILLIISAFYGFYNYLVWAGNGHFVLLKSFKFERVIVLLPALWLVLFAVALSKLEIRNWKLAAWFLASQIAIGVLANDEFSQNLRQLAGHPRKPNFQSFFDEKLFAEIDRHIGLPKETYRVVSLGMHPSVAQYNGFYTLDRHSSLYDLRYKHQFRQIMAGELDKNPMIKKEFDAFGNRCYLYSAELGKEHNAFLCGKNSARRVKHLDLDPEALCGMGGCYLLSAVEIENATQTGLRLERVFEGRFWRVHLYEVTGKLLAQIH